jgi:uncharacterized protein YegP (UPF0339 family)
MHEIEIFRDWRGDYRWRLIGETGRVLAASGDAYRSAERAQGAAHYVIEAIAGAKVESEKEAA